MILAYTASATFIHLQCVLHCLYFLLSNIQRMFLYIRFLKNDASKLPDNKHEWSARDVWIKTNDLVVTPVG